MINFSCQEGLCERKVPIELKKMVKMETILIEPNYYTQSRLPFLQESRLVFELTQAYMLICFFINSEKCQNRHNTLKICMFHEIKAVYSSL